MNSTRFDRMARRATAWLTGCAFAAAVIGPMPLAAQQSAYKTIALSSAAATTAHLTAALHSLHLAQTDARQSRFVITSCPARRGTARGSRYSLYCRACKRYVKRVFVPHIGTAPAPADITRALHALALTADQEPNEAFQAAPMIPADVSTDPGLPLDPEGTIISDPTPPIFVAPPVDNTPVPVPTPTVGTKAPQTDDQPPIVVPPSVPVPPPIVVPPSAPIPQPVAMPIAVLPTTVPPAITVPPVIVPPSTALLPVPARLELADTVGPRGAIAPLAVRVTNVVGRACPNARVTFHVGWPGPNARIQWVARAVTNAGGVAQVNFQIPASAAASNIYCKVTVDGSEAINAQRLVRVGLR